MERVTPEQVQQAVLARGIASYSPRSCSMCNSPLYFHFSPDAKRAGWDGGCDCSRSFGMEPRTFTDVANHFNIQTPEVRAKIWAEFIASGEGGRELEFSYTNYSGEYGVRRVIPLGIWLGSTKWHPERQWLLKAIDLEKNAERDFALKDIGTRNDGWVVGNSNRTLWRSWDSSGPIWVEKVEDATRYARREDAEKVHAEDEDAWTVLPYAVAVKGGV